MLVCLEIKWLYFWDNWFCLDEDFLLCSWVKKMEHILFTSLFFFEIHQGQKIIYLYVGAKFNFSSLVYATLFFFSECWGFLPLGALGHCLISLGEGPACSFGNTISGRTFLQYNFFLGMVAFRTSKHFAQGSINGFY